MSNSYMRYCGPQIIQRAFTTLCGLLEGVDADKEINKLETDSLKTWFQDNLKLKNKKPFSEIFSRFAEIIADGVIEREEFLDLKWICEKYKGNGVFYDSATKDIQFLHGLVAGISSDNKINEKEVNSLRDWLVNNEHLQGKWPYDEFYSLCLSCLRDGKIDEKERIELTSYFKEFLNFNGNKALTVTEHEKLPISGICSIDPIIEFEYKRFVLTGNSSKASRAKIKLLIEDCAGQVDERITHKTDYLIVMAEGNSAWAYSAYGRKVEQAMELRKQNIKVVIVHENDLWDALRDEDVA